MCVI